MKKAVVEETDAHKAFSSMNSELSKRFGEFVKSIVFGGLDGIITTFAIVAAAIGSQLSYSELLIVGFANLVGDGFAMGLGDFFSSKAEDDQAKALRKRYLWECEKYPAKQKVVMKGIFVGKGFDENEAQKIVDCLGENKQAFADIMLLELDGVSVEEDSSSPLKNGLITFFSFLLFGAIPLISFIFSPDKKQRSRALSVFFYISVGLTAMSLFLLGVLQNMLLRRSWWKGGFVVLLQGGFATGIAYLVGYLLEMLVMNH